jgi:kynureninase
MAEGFRDWPTPHAENWAKLRRLEKALWRVADWPAVGAATKELEKRGVVLDHRTPEVVHFVHQPRHGFVDPA